MWSQKSITTAGAALMSSCTAGDVLTITAVKGGTGTSSDLAAMTALTNQKQIGSIASITKSSGVTTVKAQFGAASAAYTLNQIGFFAKLNNGAETLFAVFQDEVGVSIPASPAAQFLFTFYGSFVVSVAGTFTATIDTDAFVTLEPDGKLSSSIIPDPTVLTGSGAPSTSTVGYVSQYYLDTTNDKLYFCKAVASSTYTWVRIPINVDYANETVKECFATNALWTPPNNLVGGKINITLVGGGGGGGAGHGVSYPTTETLIGGGGGGSGARNVSNNISVTAGNIYRITIGKGATAVAPNNKGNSGGQTKFEGTGISISANGGGGGDGGYHLTSNRPSGNTGAGGSGGSPNGHNGSNGTEHQGTVQGYNFEAPGGSGGAGFSYGGLEFGAGGAGGQTGSSPAYGSSGADGVCILEYTVKVMKSI